MYYRIDDDKLKDFADYKYEADCMQTSIISVEELRQAPNKVIVQDGVLILNPDYETEEAQKRKEQFDKEFFLTSLGYIRRKVSMQTGETKDFLSDLLPTISMGVNLGQNIPIITYKEPDFTEENLDMVALQEIKTATSEFVNECFMQLSNDFMPAPISTPELSVEDAGKEMIEEGI